MRIPSILAVASAALFLMPSVGFGQSLAEAAAKEKARRKALEESRKKPARSYSDADLANAKGSNASFPSGADAPASTEEPTTGSEAPGAAPKEGEKTEEQIQAEASAGWRKSLDAATKDAATYRDQAAKIQNDLNDTSGGLYSSRRATLVTLLEETQRTLAETEAKVADLEEQGRRNGYR
jgi:hypothetical protein